MEIITNFYPRILESFHCKPEIDLFASCINYQIGQHALWHPDTNAIAIDAFSISWSEFNFYAFPPFSLIGAAIAKVRQKRCSGIMIIPWWKIQFWFPMMVITEKFPDTSSSKYTDFTIQKISKTPTYSKMKLLAVHLSGKASETQTFQEKLQMLSQIRGEQPPEVVTNQFSGNGLFMQLQGTRIPVLQI